MTWLGLLVLLVLIGVGLYLVNAVIPMDSKIKAIINVVVVILALVIVANAFGVFGSIDRPIGHPLR